MIQVVELADIDFKATYQHVPSFKGKDNKMSE